MLNQDRLSKRRREEIDQNKREATEKFDQILVTSIEGLDRNLRAVGKRGLLEPGEDGVRAIDTLLAPLRQRYEEWGQRGFAEDYLVAPLISEEKKEAARFWTTGLMHLVEPEEAERTRVAIDLWAYGQYVSWAVRDLWSYAEAQDLEESIYLTLPIEKRDRARVETNLLRHLWAYDYDGTPPDDVQQQESDLARLFLTLPDGQPPQVLSELSTFVRKSRPDLSEATQTTISGRLEAVFIRALQESQLQEACRIIDPTTG